MEKPAITTLKIHKLIQRRWSPRAFSTEKLKKESLYRIIEAARWSASCFNEQPWRFILGTKDENESWDKIYSFLSERNQIWCKNVPVLILFVAKRTFSHNQKPNQGAEYDLGQSAAYVSMQAISEDIFVHQMAGFDASKAKEIFQIPDDFEPKTVMALGYRGDPNLLPDDFKRSEFGERKRKNLDDLLFTDKWGVSGMSIFD